jgi:hypothetical protein
VTVGLVPGGASLPAAFRTIAEPAGTVTVIFLSASEVTLEELP